MGQTFSVLFTAILCSPQLLAPKKLYQIVNSSLYHWADIQYVGKFWSEKKLVKLASGIPFVNFTLQILLFAISCSYTCSSFTNVLHANSVWISSFTNILPHQTFPMYGSYHSKSNSIIQLRINLIHISIDTLLVTVTLVSNSTYQS